jgi:hypothetical protein
MSDAAIAPAAGDELEAPKTEYVKPKRKKAKTAKQAVVEKATKRVKRKLKTAAKRAAAEPKKKRDKSNRLKVFEALSKSDGLKNTELRKKIGMSEENGQLGVILRGEITKKRILAKDYDGVIYYSLSALGKNHLGKGIVDSWSRENHLVLEGRAWEKTAKKAGKKKSKKK